jgi:hypothetical protein
MCVCDPATKRCTACGVEDFFCGSPRACPALAESPEPVAPPTHGPGTELKKLLAKVGITASPNCSCKARAAEMDRREHETPGWCDANLDTIVGWLREQAEARGLPFLDIAGRLLVKRAIANARRNA